MKYTLVNGGCTVKVNNTEILCLPDSMTTTFSLLMNKGIIPSVNKGNMVCFHNVESDTATLDGSKENLAVWILLETFKFSNGRMAIKVTIETSTIDSAVMTKNALEQIQRCLVERCRPEGHIRSDANLQSH